MKLTLQVLILLFSNFIYCQYEMVDAKMDAMPKENESTTSKVANYINQNFLSVEDKVRAAFYWTASNISYDVASMFEPKKQTTAEKINSALKTRKGVCMHYSEVFSAITNEMGIKTVLISGYTKQYGKIAPLSHVWNASKIDGKWYVLDVTWAAGSIKDKVFYKKLNNQYYKPTTHDFLKTHMPFDFIWQFNDKPITNDDFYNDKLKSDLISNSYDFNNAIVQYENLSELEKIQSKLGRIEQAGLKNEFVKTEYNAFKKNYEGFKNNNSIPTLQLIVAAYNDANKLLTEFINYRNRKFTPLLTDDLILKKAQLPYDKLLYCKEELDKIVNVSKENLANFNALKKVVATSQKLFDEQLYFVTQYLSKTTAERAATFLTKRK